MNRTLVATKQHRPAAASAGSPAANLRVALFSGNYNYTRDGANNVLNKLVGHLLEKGASVRVYSPTSENPAFPPTGDLVSVPSISMPGRAEFRLALGLPRNVARDVQDFAPNIIHVSAPDWLGTGAQRLARQISVPVVALRLKLGRSAVRTAQGYSWPEVLNSVLESYARVLQPPAHVHEVPTPFATSTLAPHHGADGPGLAPGGIE